LQEINLLSFKFFNNIAKSNPYSHMSKEKENKAFKKEKLKRFLTKRNIIITIIAVFFSVQYIQMQSILGTFSFLEDRDSSLIGEIGQLKETYTSVGTDLNEVREFLRMPTKSYAGFDEPDAGEDSDKNDNELQLAFFQYVDFLATTKKIEKNLAIYKPMLEGLVASESFQSFLKEQNLTLSTLVEDDDSMSLIINGPDGEELALYYYSKIDGVLFFKTLKIKEEVETKVLVDLEKSLQDFLKKNKDSLLGELKKIKDKQKSIDAAITSAETVAAIGKLGITLEAQSVNQNLKITYSIYSKSGDLIGEIALDTTNGKINLIDKNNQDFSLEANDINKALIPFLSKLDTKTFIEKKVVAARNDIETTIKDEGFKLLLSQSGLKIGASPREDDDRLYYDIYLDSNKLSSIVVEKSTGVINIVQPEGTNSQNILFFDPEFKKKTLEIPDQLPNYSDTPLSSSNTFNILIAGKHGSLVDTMIFAHIDEDKRTVRMISIPRDLYYNGRKINSLPYFYGMPELKKVLSDLTGYQLDKYILIDMYAFIEVIDLIGGIDIHLNSAVIDPTYRTVDNGKVGTLHYEPGDYHLGGVEALRLARTRHTSSDFARAERQQKILEAIQDKAQNFGFGDADTIYEIAKTVLGKTETDVSLDEALAYYFRYQNYKIESNNVMSSGNVLYVPPYITTENCNAMMSAAAAAGQPDPGCENKNHGYTLLPLNDNWNIVKWFFRENFEGV